MADALAGRLAAASVSDRPSPAADGPDHLLHVMRAVEGAEATIRNQDLTAKVKENEEEIAQLRKHLADYSVKAFDQQQQDLIDAASKALSYRQDIIEENIRLTYAVQAAHQERTTFISSLLPLLSEYENLQPSVLDAQSIVTNLKVLFKHLQEQLILTENKNNLDIVPQTPYPHIQSPISSPVQVRGDWDVAGNKNRQVIPTDVAPRNVNHDDMGRNSLSSSNKFRRDVSAEVSQPDFRSAQLDFETQSQNPPFKHLSRSDVSDVSEGAEAQHVQEHSAHWGHGNTPNLVSGIEDTNPSYPYLPTVLEEPGSSFSEGARQPNYLVTADDVDTLLAIEVQPLDDRKRKGEFVRVYANDQRKITCDPETKELIKRTLEIGHVSYEVQLPINIPNGRPTEFLITSADGVEYNLKPAENTQPRDTIVLVLRLFRIMAVEKRRGRKKILFFK
uniref:DUF7046 domain-containing protein n=1 Tax=Leersia perrieri TaxID=77586 RepID=A0A0D9UVV8_9ORYZ